MAPPIITCIKR